MVDVGWLRLCSAEAWILTPAGCWWARCRCGCAQDFGHVARAQVSHSFQKLTLKPFIPGTPSSEQRHSTEKRPIYQQPSPACSDSFWQRLAHPSLPCAVCDSSGWSGALSRSPACALQALSSARGGARTRWAPRLTCFRAALGRRARCCTGKDPCNGPHGKRSLRFPRCLQDPRVLN